MKLEEVKESRVLPQTVWVAQGSKETKQENANSWTERGVVEDGKGGSEDG